MAMGNSKNQEDLFEDLSVNLLSLTGSRISGIPHQYCLFRSGLFCTWLKLGNHEVNHGILVCDWLS